MCRVSCTAVYSDLHPKQYSKRVSGEETEMGRLAYTSHNHPVLDIAFDVLVVLESIL